MRATRRFSTVVQTGFWAVLFILPCAGAAQITDAVNGYTVRPPAGWKAMPDDVLQQTMGVVRKQGAANAPQFVAAYEPANHTTPFQYPYVMIQRQPYPGGTSISTISRKELDQMVSQITGVRPEQMKEALSDDIAGLVNDAKIDAPTVIASPPGFVMGSKLDVAGVGPVRGRSIARLGRTNAVFLHFYAKESDWPAHASTCAAFFNGFQRTPDQAVTTANVTRSTDGRTLGGGFDWSRVGRMALVGAVIGAIV